jgi:hypothetical protein
MNHKLALSLTSLDCLEFRYLDNRVRKEYSIVGIAKGINSFEHISVVQNAN